VGLYINSFLGPVDLARNYQLTVPAIIGLRSQPNSIIAMSHEYVAQALAPSLLEKTFFLTEESEDVKQLSNTLLSQGRNEFLYVCYPYRDCNIPQASPEELKFSRSNQPFTMQFSDLGKFGKYPVYEVSIVPSSSLLSSRNSDTLSNPNLK
jgi:hypothetical protein